MGKPIGPGPGAYKLPPTVGYNQHDGTRYRFPMYSIGMNVRYQHKLPGPGPAYKLERETQYGKEFTPAWSFGARYPYRRVLQVPGPGAHAPEKCPPMREQRPPAYSLGAKLGFAEKSRGPASNAYAIRFGPGSAAWSMAARLGYQTKTKSPGPAVYFQRDLEVYAPKAPKFSLGAKLDGPGKPTRTPGPAAYPPNLYNTKKAMAAYSFGTHHSPWAPPMIIDEDTMDCL